MVNLSPFTNQGHFVKFSIVISFTTGFFILLRRKQEVKQLSNIIYVDDISQKSLTESLEAYSLSATAYDTVTNPPGQVSHHTNTSYRQIKDTERLARARSLLRQQRISKVEVTIDSDTSEDSLASSTDLTFFSQKTILPQLCKPMKGDTALQSSICQMLPDSEIEKQSKASYRDNSTLGHGGYFASPVSDVVLMSMSKTGSSNLLVLMCIAQGPPCLEGIDSPDFGVRKDTQKFMKKLSGEEIQRKLADYHFVFTTVRNPWKRLVSAWNHKFVNKHRKTCSMVQSVKSRRVKWTFNDFIRECVIKRWEQYGPLFLDQHWRPQSIQGAFCSVNYDFIGSTETMDEDVSVIMKELRLDVDTALPKAYSVRRPFEREQMTSLIYNQTWASIDKKTIDKLKLIYAVDFLMFDYPDYPL